MDKNIVPLEPSPGVVFCLKGIVGTLIGGVEIGIPYEHIRENAIEKKVRIRDIRSIKDH